MVSEDNANGDQPASGAVEAETAMMVPEQAPPRTDAKTEIPEDDVSESTTGGRGTNRRARAAPGVSRHDTLLPTDSVVVDGINHGRLFADDEDNDDDNDDEGREEPWHKRLWKRWAKFYAANSFLVLVLAAILIAYAYPPLGAIYLAPHITATWIAVVFIFIMAGLGLKTEEFSKAFQRLHFNLTVQAFNFGVVSAGVYGFSRLLIKVGALAQSLGDGMVICASLPLTVNMVLVLTKSGGGDEAAAVFNAAFGNMVGVFLSPALILGYLGVTGGDAIDLGAVFYKLGLRVVLPIAIGQILQKFSKTVVAFVKKYKKHFKTVQEYCLVFIVYTVFCKTFLNGSDAGVGDIFLMMFLQFVLLCFFMAVAWYVLKLLFRNSPKLRVMGLFGCTHKTVAMGVPLINAIYEDNPNVGLYTLPLLIWHPMQLVLGSALAPRLSAFVEREEKRLAETKDGNGHGTTESEGRIQQGGSTDTVEDGGLKAEESTEEIEKELETSQA